jgi:hypothetical protein
MNVFVFLRPGGRFVFTSHDRWIPKWKKFWENEQKKMANWACRIKLLIEFGDRYGETPTGRLFIHVPDRSIFEKIYEIRVFYWNEMLCGQKFLMRVSW